MGVAILAASAVNLLSLQRTLALENARATTLALTQQQGEYNEVRTASQLLQSTTAAQIFATSTEISVQTVVDDLGDKLTGAMFFSSYSFETATPLLGYGASVSPLDPERIAQFSIEITASSVAEIDSWVRSAPDVDGVADVSLVSVKQEEGTYLAQVAVFVTRDALLHRFDGFVEEEEGADEAAPAEGTNDEENGS
ncbi:fimbrial assembly protein [Salinibacterium sp. SWN139]|nr:fimbrial assembly protein [Salinibacterium sp. SWN139]